MAVEITVPRLGWNMEEGVFVGWLKKDGDEVRPGDALFTLEGEKATEDIECLDSGILRIPAGAPKAGDRVPVGAVIGYVTQPGEAVPNGEVAAVKDRAAPSPQLAAVRGEREYPASSPPRPPDRAGTRHRFDPGPGRRSVGTHP